MRLRIGTSSKIFVDLALRVSNPREENRDLISTTKLEAEFDVSDDRDFDYIPSSPSSNSSVGSSKSQKSEVVNKLNIISDVVLTSSSVSSTSKNNNLDIKGINELYLPHETDSHYVYNLVEKLILNAIEISENKKLTKSGQPRKRKMFEESLAERRVNKTLKLITKQGAAQ
ncbi:hypothetical protein FQA39_LY04203 [Lamprigera yunnana]|nr:hypothetical protein FQA39_LY04203 [Lamprigera yunnana]